MSGIIIGLWLGLAAVAANLPWLTERRWLVLARRQGQIKPVWLRVLEWGALYGLALGAGFGLERRLMGVIQAQDWEFYVITLCLFAVAAMPGLIYRYQVRRLLERAG